MSRPTTLAASESDEGGRAMERTDMATPEKSITRDKLSMTNSQSPQKTKPTRCYPPGDALELTLASPFLTRGQCAVRAQLCVVNAWSMRGYARFEHFPETNRGI